jgi:hypothetical protein
METDKTTLNDLSIFNSEEEFSVFNKLNLTRTTGGRERLRYIFTHSLNDIESIKNVQETLKLIIREQQQWPLSISNGTVLMIYKFYESSIDDPPSRPTPITAAMYKLLHGPDFSLIKYSVGHAFEFIKGMKKIVSVFLTDNVPLNLKRLLEKAEVLILKSQFQMVIDNEKPEDLSNTQILAFGYYIRYHYKQNFLSL